MAEWKPKSFQPSTFKPDVSGAESFVRGAWQGGSMGFADEQAGALDAIGGHLKRTFTGGYKNTGGGLWEDIKAEAEQVADDYRRGRDESRQAYEEAAEANPTAYGVGQFGGAVGVGLATGGASALGRAGLKGALTAGALEGAAGGLGGSNADLTHADLDAYAKAFRDSTEGGVTGAGLGAAFYGAGKGLKWAGGKALGALRSARGELEAGVAAEREAADELARAAEEKAAGRLVKDEYAARQQNARMDERVAREEAKRAAKEARDAARAKAQQQKDFRAANERTQVDKRYADPNVIPIRRGAPAPQAATGVPMEDPNTQILGGYRGKAGERRAVNYDRVQQYRRDIADPNFTGDRARLEQYARDYGDAVDNPGAFERRMVERYLRENYPPEVADRILRERVGPNGEILPRRTSQAASSPETPQGMAPPRPQPFDYSEADRLINELRRPGQPPARDYSDESVARIIREARPEPITQAADMGDAMKLKLGWGSAWDDHGPGQKTAVDWVSQDGALAPRGRTPPLSGDPFNDAKTDFGLAYMGEAPHEPGAIGGADEYRFIDPKTNRPYRIKTFNDPRDPEAVSLEYIGPDDVSPVAAMGGEYNAEKNMVGPGVLRKIFRELRSEYPEAQHVVSERMTGWNGGRNLEMRLPPLPGQAERPSSWVNPRADTVVEQNIRDLLPPANPNARRTAGIYEVPLSELDDIPAAGMRKPVAAAEIRRALERGEELPPIRVGQGPDGLRELEDGNHRLAAYRERGTPNVWAQFESDAAAQVNPNRARGTSMFDNAVAPMDSRPKPPPPTSGDPVHDAKTKIALVETSPDKEALLRQADELDRERLYGYADQLRDEAKYRTFEFRDPRSGGAFKIETVDTPSGDVRIERIERADGEGITREAWDQDANSIGPGLIRQLLPDLAAAFPNARSITGKRVTGIRRGKDFSRPAQEMSIPIPESARGENPALIRQRERGLGSRNMGAAAFGDETLAYSNQDILRAQDAVGEVTQVGREPPVSGDDLRQWLDLTQEARGGPPEGLPPLEDITSPGGPVFPRGPSDAARRSPVFSEVPRLREAYQPQQAPQAAPTRDLRAAQPAPAAQPRPSPAYDPNNSMVSPRDFDAETVVPLGETQVPRAPRPEPYAGPVAPELAPEPMQVSPLRQARPRPLAPPVAPPAQTVMGAPPGSLVRQARQSVGEIAQQREQDALGDVVRAGWEGMRGANNALAAPFGAAYGIGKEALQNPAVRARAISLFRLDRLARVRPEVWARVGPTLQRAFQAGPERFKAERHVLLLRDPEFRAAEAEADAELERMDGQPPTRRAAGVR